MKVYFIFAMYLNSTDKLMLPDYRSTFPMHADVNNIEFGAGRGFFGKVEFPNCFLTDINENGLRHVSDISEPTHDDCHYLDGLIDYYNSEFNGRRFNKLVFCNPFLFGFNGKYATTKFLTRAEELLNDNGEIFVLGQHANRWVRKDKAQKFIAEYNVSSSSNWRIVEELSENQIRYFNERHTFRKSTGEAIFANVGYILKFN